MTKKTYTVLKAALRMDGVDYSEGDDVALEPGQAQKLLGTFVEEKTATSSKGIAPAAAPALAASGKAKAADGL